MDILILERRHGNGALARVYRDDEGAGYRAASYPMSEDDEPAWPYVDSIDEAQAEADALAHPNCVGKGCGPWKAR